MAKCTADFLKLVTKFLPAGACTSHTGTHIYVYKHMNVHTCLFYKQNLDMQIWKSIWEQIKKHVKGILEETKIGRHKKKSMALLITKHQNIFRIIFDIST